MRCCVCNARAYNDGSWWCCWLLDVVSLYYFYFSSLLLVSKLIVWLYIGTKMMKRLEKKRLFFLHIVHKSSVVFSLLMMIIIISSIMYITADYILSLWLLQRVLKIARLLFILSKEYFIHLILSSQHIMYKKGWLWLCGLPENYWFFLHTTKQKKYICCVCSLAASSM